MALQALLKDSGFQIPSPSAKEAHLAASDMLEWLATTDNAALAAPLSEEMTAALSKCLPQGSTLSRAKREKMWGKFHHTRTSVEFKRTWLHLMQLSIGKSASPIFYQYVTDIMFKSMIKRHYRPTSANDFQNQDIAPLDYNEKNALRALMGRCTLGRFH